MRRCHGADKNRFPGLNDQGPEAAEASELLVNAFVTLLENGEAGAFCFRDRKGRADFRRRDSLRNQLLHRALAERARLHRRARHRTSNFEALFANTATLLGIAGDVFVERHASISRDLRGNANALPEKRQEVAAVVRARGEGGETCEPVAVGDDCFARASVVDVEVKKSLLPWMAGALLPGVVLRLPSVALQPSLRSARRDSKRILRKRL